MQIDREKLLEWLKSENPYQPIPVCKFIIRLVDKIDYGYFDIKEDTDHADRG